MKKGIIILCFLVVCKTSFSQITDTGLLSVIYQFKHMRDTSQRSYFYEEDMEMKIGKRIALYHSLDYKQNRQKLEQAIMSNEGNNINLGNINYRRGIPDEIYIVPLDKKMFTIKNFKGNKFNVVDSIAFINWEITGQTKNIQGFLCQKAIGKYRGRIYGAWFTTDLPYPYGPWRLYGLPGLILEATDTKGEVMFLCKEVKQNSNSAIVFSNTISRTTPKEYNRMVDTYFNDPSSMEGVQSVQLSTTSTSNPKAKKRTFNNPIELSKD